MTRSDAVSGANYAYQSTWKGSTTSRINADGSIYLGGGIEGTDPSAWTPNVYIGYNGSAHFAGNVTSDGTIGFNLEADNPANYTVTTSTDEEGNEVETRVYNGPTLDVKTVIQELQQRVADRDATISNLTTRLGALEARLSALEGSN